MTRAIARDRIGSANYRKRWAVFTLFLVMAASAAYQQL